MQIRKVKFIDKNKVLNFGRISFNLGGFFLPSALPISLIFFIFAILSSIYIHKPSIYKDKWNFTLLITSALMIISSLKGYLIQPSISIGFDKTEIFINLFN